MIFNSQATLSAEPQTPPTLQSLSGFFCFVIGSQSDADYGGPGNGGLYAGARRGTLGAPPVNAPATALCPWDFGAPVGDVDTGRITYIGGGGWGAPDAHHVQLYAAPPPYDEATDTGELTFAVSHQGGVIGRVAQLRGSVRLMSELSVSLGASVNNFSPAGLAGANTMRLTPTAAAVSITGLAGGTSGRIMVVQNMSAALTLTLTHEDALSLAANRFVCPGAVALVIPVSGNTLLRYDGPTSRWRPLWVT